MHDDEFWVRAIGRVRSAVRSVAQAPLQGTEGAPESTLELAAGLAPAATDLHPGQELLVLTWLHLADRAVLRVHPRGDPRNPEEGVFSTRSPDRPNPIGVHRVTVVAVDGSRIRVRDLEAVDGTPIIDIKPVLHPRER
ncbi:MAG TPA: tRNA (N6-threonylcarbamoyladenosine(37)-N6)-methyltransferase TrmO [Solirubrobacteraceae bacterium]|nr:tRNA (N6-threonylcarbamoyladenosine(37)-N6)-methyltransferase TrmO [Solirubrobacteraceae bacterium]